MNKQRVVALVISGVLLMSTATYAKGRPNTEGVNKQSISQEVKQSNESADKNKVEADNEKNIEQNNGQTKKQANEAKRTEKQQQIDAFKAEIKAKHETMKQIRQQTKEVKTQIETKTDELNSILEDIKAGNKTLSEDMLNTLLSDADSLKTHSDEVKATSGISKDVAETQDKVEKKDFSNALSSLDKVIAKLQGRLDALNKLNSSLDDALAIARLAVAPAPADTTTNITTY